MLVPVFSFRFEQEVAPRLVAAGQLESARASIAAVTPAGRLFVHSIGDSNGTSAGGGVGRGSMRFLSLSQRITALQAGLKLARARGDDNGVENATTAAFAMMKKRVMMLYLQRMATAMMLVLMMTATAMACDLRSCVCCWVWSVLMHHADVDCVVLIASAH
jgi:hypothetical protein